MNIQIWAWGDFGLPGNFWELNRWRNQCTFSTSRGPGHWCIQRPGHCSTHSWQTAHIPSRESQSSRKEVWCCWVTCAWTCWLNIFYFLFHNKKPLNKHQKNKGTLLLAVQCSLFSGLVPIDCSRRTHFSCCATLQHRNQKARGWIAVHQRLYHDDYLLYIQWIPAVPGTIRFVCAVWPQHSQRLPWNQEGVYKIETRLWLWSIVKGSFGFIDDAVVILAIL